MRKVIEISINFMKLLASSAVALYPYSYRAIASKALNPSNREFAAEVYDMKHASYVITVIPPNICNR